MDETPHSQPSEPPPAAPRDQDTVAEPRQPWRRPQLTRIPLQRTLLGSATGTDGSVATFIP